jgi:putative thiamine transport system permease protein
LAKFRPGPKLPSLIIVFLLAGPVLAGLAGTVLPAFGYLPVLGARTLTFAPFAQLLSMPGLLHSTALSFWTGLVASLVSLAIVLCFAAAWSGTHTFQRVSRFLSPLLSVPHAAAAIGLAFLIAPSGFLARLLSPWATGWERPPDLLLVNDPYGIAMTLGLVAKEVPFLFLMTLAALNRPEIKSYTKVATSLGYGRMSGFFKVILPQIYPLIRLPMLAVIAYSTSVVDVAVILGPTTPAPLAARLVVWMNDPDLNLRLAASAGALLQLGISAGAILVYLLFEASVTKLSFTRFALGHRVKSDGAGRMAALGTMIFIVSAMCLSLLVLMIWSFAKSWWYPAPLPQNWSVSAFSMALMQTPQILGTTILLGVLAALISTSLTLWLLESKTNAAEPVDHRLRTLIFVPLLLPQIAFLFGLKMLFLMIGLDGSLTAVLLAHLVFVLPYAFLALSEPWQRQDPRYARVAASMGASRARIFFRVQLPMLTRPVLVTLAVALAVSVGQYLPTLMIGAGRVVTVTTESVALASGGNRQITAVYALLQLLIPFAGFAVAAAIPAVLFKNRTALRLDD